jgi:type II secretory pathway component PulF
MSRWIRGFAAALVASAVLLSGVVPAFASTYEGYEAAQKHTPAVVDAMFLRPVGLVMTMGGIVLFVPAGAFTAITRPTNIGKPFKTLVATPFRYTFLDPIGEHPPTRALEQ